MYASQCHGQCIDHSKAPWYTHGSTPACTPVYFDVGATVFTTDIQVAVKVFYSEHVCAAGHFLRVQEVCALQACVAEGVLTHGQMDALLLDLGLVLQHIEGGPSPPGLRHHDIAEKARRLLAFAADQGCAAMAKAVLPLASAQCECASDVVAAIHASTAKVSDGGSAEAGA